MDIDGVLDSTVTNGSGTTAVPTKDFQYVKFGALINFKDHHIQSKQKPLSETGAASSMWGPRRAVLTPQLPAAAVKEDAQGHVAHPTSKFSPNE
jgi:hypothetical protein